MTARAQEINAAIGELPEAERVHLIVGAARDTRPSLRMQIIEEIGRSLPLQDCDETAYDLMVECQRVGPTGLPRPSLAHCLPGPEPKPPKPYHPLVVALIWLGTTLAGIVALIAICWIFLVWMSRETMGYLAFAGVVAGLVFEMFKSIHKLR